MTQLEAFHCAEGTCRISKSPHHQPEHEKSSASKAQNYGTSTTFKLTKHHQTSPNITNPCCQNTKLCSSSGAAAKALRASGSGAIEDQDALRGRKRSTALRPAPRTIQSCRCLDHPRSPKGPEICNLKQPPLNDLHTVDSKSDQQIKPYQQCQSLPVSIVCRESVLSLSLSLSLFLSPSLSQAIVHRSASVHRKTSLKSPEICIYRGRYII